MSDKVKQEARDEVEFWARNWRVAEQELNIAIRHALDAGISSGDLAEIIGVSFATVRVWGKQGDAS